MRRRIAILGLLILIVGCQPSTKPNAVWGQRGVRDGDFVRPRAAVIDGQNRLWIVDFTARIQAFDLEGAYIGPTFTTPDFRNGRPSGLGQTHDGRLIVCDSHYHAIRIYDVHHQEVQTIGGNAGHAEGEFGYISDAVQDADGFIYVAEFGINERITKVSADGRFVKCWGKPGIEPGEFNRPRALALGPDGLLYIADACNHRLQVFTRDGEFVRIIGQEGTQPGELKYPYDLAFGPKGELYIAERGNHRVQRMTTAGVSEGVWGNHGRQPGQLADPWALVVDQRGWVYVIDTENHRVQRIKL